MLLKPQDETAEEQHGRHSLYRYKKACVHTAGPTESDSRTSSLDFPPTLNNNNTSKEIKIGGGTKNIFDADSPTKARQRRGGCFSASEVCELINAGFTQISQSKLFNTTAAF